MTMLDADVTTAKRYVTCPEGPLVGYPAYRSGEGDDILAVVALIPGNYEPRRAMGEDSDV